MKKLQYDIDQNIKDYRFDYITRNIQFFLRDIFCDFFVEFMKFQDDEETKDIAGIVFAEFLRISNPVIPFVTDHLAQVLDICDSFVLNGKVDLSSITIDEKAEKEVDEFVALTHELRSEKQANSTDSEKYQALYEKLNNWQGELSDLIGIVR